MAARLQFPRMTSSVQDLISQLKALGGDSRQGKIPLLERLAVIRTALTQDEAIPPTGQDVCRLYKSLRDIYAIGPSFTMVLKRLREVAGTRSVTYIVLTAILGLAAVATSGTSIFAVAALGTASEAVKRGIKWERSIRGMCIIPKMHDKTAH
jgi:hypothetical protein